jgi:hypothetical protein
MPNDDIFTVLNQYLRGEIEVAEAAETLTSSGGGRPGFSISMHGLDSRQQERVETLMGRLMWLTLRAHAPDVAPAEPFDAAGWRALREQVEREGKGDSSDGATATND